MRMRQSISELEQQFAEQARAEQRRRAQMVREAERRAFARERDRIRRVGTVRFAALVLVLLATAVLVTVAMFQALYWVMG